MRPFELRLSAQLRTQVSQPTVDAPGPPRPGNARRRANFPDVIKVWLDGSLLLRWAIFAGLAILAQVAMSSSLEAFGTALAVESTVLGIWAALLAVKATDDARSILDGLGDIKAAAASLAESAQEERAVLARLLAREELILLRAVERAAPALWAKLLQFPGETPPSDRGLLLLKSERREYHDALYLPLREAEGLPLPRCRELHNLLSELIWAFGLRQGEDPDAFDFMPQLMRADEELRRAIANRAAQLR